MCLRIDDKVTEKVKARLRRGGGKARFWKIYCRKRKSLCSSVFWTNKGGLIRSPGRKASNRRDHSLSCAERREGLVHFGYHVCAYKRDADRRRCNREYLVVVPVWCHEKDFVAGGFWGPCRFKPDEQNAVFTHIEITPEDFAKAVGAQK